MKYRLIVKMGTFLKFVNLKKGKNRKKNRKNKLNRKKNRSRNLLRFQSRSLEFEKNKRKGK